MVFPAKGGLPGTKRAGTDMKHPNVSGPVTLRWRSCGICSPTSLECQSGLIVAPCHRKAMPSKRRKSFLHRHSLSLVTAFVLCTWITLYIRFNPSTHWAPSSATQSPTGLAFSSQSSPRSICSRSVRWRAGCPPPWLRPVAHWRILVEHLSGDHRCWVDMAVRQIDPNSWGQVAGNIVSEWTQIFGMVWLTKKL